MNLHAQGDSGERSLNPGRVCVVTTEKFQPKVFKFEKRQELLLRLIRRIPFCYILFFSYWYSRSFTCLEKTSPDFIMQAFASAKHVLCLQIL